MRSLHERQSPSVFSAAVFAASDKTSSWVEVPVIQLVDSRGVADHFVSAMVSTARATSSKLAPTTSTVSFVLTSVK